MKLRLLLYSYDWAPLVGGVQTITLDLAEGLHEWSRSHNDEAIDVTLITETPAGSMDDSNLPFPVIRRPSLSALFNHIRAADVVHIANPTLLPLALAWLLRTPTVVEHHGYQSICPNGILLYHPDTSVCPGHFMAGHYGKCVECNSAKRGTKATWQTVVLTFPRRWICKHVAVNVAVTEHVARRLSLPRTRTILHGIRITDPKPEVKSPSNGHLPQIGYVGRLVTEKGVPTLLAAASKLRDSGLPFHLVLIGDGAEREALEHQSRRLGLENQVTFTGYLTGAAFEKALDTLNIVVMPSQWEETAGLAVMEKMMRGGVVVVSDIGGLSEVVGDAGLKFIPGDANSLYDRLRQILEKPSMIASLGSASRARAIQYFNRDSMIHSHIALYREVLSGRTETRDR